MAADTPVTPARETFFNKDVAGNRTNSSAIMNKFARMANFFQERIYNDENFEYSGFFEQSTSINNGIGGVRFVENIMDIDMYYLSIYNIGTSGTSSFNFTVYDNNGASQGDLFTTAVSINGTSNLKNVIVGKKKITTTPVDIDVNVTGVTHNNGALNITTLETGWYIVPKIVSNAANAYNANLKLRFKEQ